MAICVMSSGRSGTNLVLEILTGCKELKASADIEDKLLFKRLDVVYKKDYLTKCDSNYLDGYFEFKRLLDTDLDFKIIWTVRHPFDWCLSKIYRGWDSADDATVDGCISDMYFTFSIFLTAIQEYKNRIIVIRMEDVLLDIEKETRKMCDFLEIEFDEDMLNPHLRMRHKGKKERYKILDKSQINLYKDLDKLYDGFFNEHKEIDLEKLFVFMKPLVSYYGYTI